MSGTHSSSQFVANRLFFRAAALTALLTITGTLVHGQQAKVAVLQIASTGTITGKADSPKEKAGHATLRKFIKEETGLDNEIVGQLDWQDLAAKMTQGKYHLGVFQGYEFAWAQEKEPNLKPLAIGINVYRYPVACVVVKRDNPAKDFGGLKGQSFVAPATGQSFLQLFVERNCDANHQTAAAFFAKITATDNIEDALDDIVDGKEQATVIDQAALDAYKQRKPGRFNQLKEIVRSQPFPPVVVAYYGSFLDEPTLRRFKDGLLNAGQKEKGELLLTLSRLSAFEPVPADFGPVLAQTRKVYPSGSGK